MKLRCIIVLHRNQQSIECPGWKTSSFHQRWYDECPPEASGGSTGSNSLSFCPAKAGPTFKKVHCYIYVCLKKY